MKHKMIEVKVFEKGDYVITPEGVGIVTEDEVFENEEEFLISDVAIQHKNGTSSNPSNNVVNIEHQSIALITEDEYERLYP